jgi:cobalt-zinc-cadmium efflux system outer membrane protein
MSGFRKKFSSAVISLFLIGLSISVGYAAETVETVTREDMVNRTLQSNPDLIAARKSVERAAAEVTRSRVFPNPEMELGMETDALTAREGEGSLSVGISQELVTGGKRGYQVAIATKNQERMMREVENLERLMAAEARQGFGDLLFLQEKLRIEEETVQQAREWVVLTEGRFRAGYVPEFDVNLAKIELQERLRERENTAREMSGVRTKINALLGRSPEEGFTASGSLSVGKMEEEVGPLIETAYQFRPDLKGAQIAAESAHLRLALAKALRIPDVRLSFDYTYDTGVFDVNDRTIRDRDHLFGGRITFPLMIHDKKRGEIEEAASEEARADLEYAALQTRIRGEVVAASQELERAGGSVVALQNEILPMTSVNLNLTENAYRLGKATILEGMEARKRYLEARFFLLDAEHQYDAAITELEKAVSKTMER